LEKYIYIFSFLIGGILISLIVNKLLLSFSQSLGIRNRNDVVIRWSNESKPSLGGVSFYIVFLFAIICFSIISDKPILHDKQIIGLLIAGSISFAMGLADDTYNTKPWGKLLVQILCGITFIYSGTIIELTHIPFYDKIITIIWVVALMNSLNMLDNMDGITGITVVWILLACLISIFMIDGIVVNVDSIMVISILGALFGFLYYNVHPSKLFMGDAGSQFIGLFVAYFSTHDLWNLGLSTNTPSWVGFAICLIAFTPAAADTLTVVINRLRKGKSPMVGGKDHTTHHLVYAGLKDKQVWYVFTIIGFFSALLSLIMIYFSRKKEFNYLIVFPIYFIVVFGILYFITLKYKQPTHKYENN